MSNKVMIVGTGNVGASIAFSIINQRTTVNELILTDINSEDAEGEAMDLRDALAVAPSYIKISAGTYADAKDCDIIVLAAGSAQKPGETRMDLLKKNAAIIKDIVAQIVDSGFNGIFLVISNPMDVLTHLTWKYSGFPASRVIGSGTILDSARLRQKLSEAINVSPKSIHAFQIGEHGDSEFTFWSLSSVGGQPITSILSATKLLEIEDSVKNEVYEIIERKGATYYGIGVCAVHIINCILNDERRVLPVSSYDDFTDVYNSFPAIIGREGIVRRLNLKMSEQEGIKFQKSVNALKKAIKSVA